MYAQESQQPRILITNADEIKIKIAIRKLSDLCDGAHSVDGAGFSKYDAHFGHVLAQKSYKQFGWTFKMTVAAYKLAWRYRKQLAGCGIELPDLPAVRSYVSPKSLIISLSPSTH